MNKPRILVVDDDPKLTEVVRTFLEKTQRFEVDVQTRPAQVLATARGFRPDLILLDVNMPGKGGGEVAEEIAADAALCRTPILFLTSLLSRAETRGEVTERGGMPFLAKPVNSRVLLKTINGILAAAASN